VVRAKPAVSNQGQVDPTQPGQLPIEQHGRPHLDVAHDSPKRRRQTQGVDNGLHREGRLAGPRCPAEQHHQPRPDFDVGQLAGSHGEEHGRLAGENVITPVRQRIGGADEGSVRHCQPPF